MERKSNSSNSRSPSKRQGLSPKQSKTLKVSENQSLFVYKQPELAIKRKSQSQRYSQKFNAKEYDKCRENLTNFINELSKNPKINFISIEELQNEFKIDFEELPENNEVLDIFDAIYRRLTINNTQKRNWYSEDVILLFWLVSRYTALKSKEIKELSHDDWKHLGSFIPEKDSEKCKYKFLSLKRTNTNLYSNPWSVIEEEVLKELLASKKKEELKWDKIAKELYARTNIFRTGKLCRERWKNYLDPALKKSPWTEAEDHVLIEKICEMGKKWCDISRCLPGRNEHSVKNRYFSLLRQEKKRLKKLLMSKSKIKRRKKTFANSHRLSEPELLRSICASKLKGNLIENENNDNQNHENANNNIFNNNINMSSIITTKDFIEKSTPAFPTKEEIKEDHILTPLPTIEEKTNKPIKSIPLKNSFESNGERMLNYSNIFERNRPFHPSFGEMRDENPMFFNNFYNFMPNFLPFSLMNNPFSSPFFSSNHTISENAFTNFPQNPFTKLSDSLEKMDLKGNNNNSKGVKDQGIHQKLSEDLRIISLSHLDGQDPEKFMESKDFSITPRMDRMEMNMEENPINFLQPNNFNIKTENIDFMNLRVRKFSELNPAEKASNDMKLAVVNVKKNEIYFLQQNLNNNNSNNVNLTSDSSYKSGSFISINNSNTSNSFSARLDSIENNDNGQQDMMRRSKFVKFSNNE